MEDFLNRNSDDSQDRIGQEKKGSCENEYPWISDSDGQHVQLRNYPYEVRMKKRMMRMTLGSPMCCAGCLGNLLTGAIEQDKSKIFMPLVQKCV